MKAKRALANEIALRTVAVAELKRTRREVNRQIQAAEAEVATLARLWEASGGGMEKGPLAVVADGEKGQAGTAKSHGRSLAQGERGCKSSVAGVAGKGGEA